MSLFKRVKAHLFGREREGSTPCPECTEMMVCEVMLESESPDGSNKITSQWFRCSDCPARFHAVLVESIYDMSFQQTGFVSDKTLWEFQVEQVRKCPNFFDASCSCQAHAKFAGRMSQGIQAWHSDVPL